LNELLLPAVHEEDVGLIQKYGGMSLLGKNVIQRMLILDGYTARGKTQLANVIQEIVGRENVAQLRTKLLDQRFELYRFVKKTLLVGVDVDAEFLSTSAAYVLKGLVGGDYFNAEQKFGTGDFYFEGDFCVLITSNSRLRVKLTSDVEAWRRRLLIVRYESPPIDKKIPDFGKRLVEQEGAGILNFFLDGLAALLLDVETIGDISMTERQTKIVDALLAESDSLRHFLKARARHSDHDKDDLATDEIIKEYARYCPDMGWNPLPITEVQRALPHLMLELFRATKSTHIKRESGRVNGYQGVTFINE
jgi:phage/plasmid-associated DNA primase